MPLKAGEKLKEFAVQRATVSRKISVGKHDASQNDDLSAPARIMH